MNWWMRLTEETWRHKDSCETLKFKWKPILFVRHQNIPLKSFGLNVHREFETGMFMLSITAWAVIKTHFYLNECKLAHLLWWAACPDSSISMIDQLSSCGGGARRRGRLEDRVETRQEMNTATTTRISEIDKIFYLEPLNQVFVLGIDCHSSTSP